MSHPNDAEIDEDCKSVKECKSCKNIKTTLQFYQNNTDNDIIEYFDTYKHLMDDYHHILTKHLNNINNSDSVYAEISKSISCDISKCQKYRRNNRNRLLNDKNKSTDSNKANVDDLFIYKELLDTIHCYFIHELNVTYTLRQEFDKNIKEKTDKIDEHDLDILDSNALYYDKEVEKLKSCLTSNRDETRVQYNKFSTNIVSDDQIQKKEINDDDDDEKKSEELLYSFGYKYYYWPYYKHREWYIPKKYQNLQQEMLNFIDINDYNTTKKKSKALFSTKELRKMTSYEWQNYNIPSGLAIGLENIMAISFYTDYDNLSYEFSKTFRKISATETNDEIKARNRKYWNWSKLLTQTVECYGETMEKSKIRVFYHGVSMMYFNTFIATFCCPTSTTPQLSVAMRFCNLRDVNNSGIILELEQSAMGGSLRYFDCELISRHPYEYEKLFIGGKQPLQFRSIRLISRDETYEYFLKALSLFNKVIDSSMLGDSEKKMITKRDYGIIDRFIKHEIGIQNNKFPEYINICFNKFCQSKTIIKIHMVYMKRDYDGFCKLLLDRDHNKYFLNDIENNLLAFDHISNIFKQCTEIHSIRSEPCIDSLYLFTLVRILKRLNNNKLSKLNVIKIFGKKDPIDDDLYKKYSTYIYDKTGWKMEGNDNELKIFRNTS